MSCVPRRGLRSSNSLSVSLHGSEIDRVFSQRNRIFANKITRNSTRHGGHGVTDVTPMAISSIISTIYTWVNILLVETVKIVDLVFWVWQPDFRVPLHNSYHESDSWDDEEFVHWLDSTPLVKISGTKKEILQLSHNRVLKPCFDITSAKAEALALEHVHSQTSVPVPRVRRVVCSSSRRASIVMDYVPNSRPLSMCWESLSTWKKISVILTLRYYLHQLRQIQDANSTRPGPLGPHPSPCSGVQFTDTREGPFPTSMALMQYFNSILRQVDYNASHGHSPPSNSKPLTVSAFSPLVFTHNDLHRDNILLDDDGRLWIIDWGYAGFFPAWFEYINMRLDASMGGEPWIWCTAIKFMAEPSFSMEAWFTGIGRFRYLRKLGERVLRRNHLKPSA